MPTALKAQAAGNFDDVDTHLRAACGDFRILLESTIEQHLFNGVLNRFRPDIQTKGKLGKISKITADDISLFDELMTWYSKFEHSAPKETPVARPEPSVVKKDVENLLAWIGEFKKR